MCGNTVSILIFITVFFRLYDGHSKKIMPFAIFSKPVTVLYSQNCYSLFSVFSIYVVPTHKGKITV